MSKPELKVKPIENGTVIDHITANKALQVLKILGLPEEGTNVTIAMNVPSRLGLKDIVKDFEIVHKGQVNAVSELNGLIKCTNPKCITNTEEPVESIFYLVETNPITVRCHYCERLIQAEELSKQF